MEAVDKIEDSLRLCGSWCLLLPQLSAYLQRRIARDRGYLILYQLMNLLRYGSETIKTGINTINPCTVPTAMQLSFRSL